MNELLTSFATSVHNNLFAGDAYLVVLKGLGVTIVITFLSLLFGTILGALLCALRMARFAALRIIAHSCIAVLRGSPVLLLLMIMYYVVFADSRIDAVIVAIMAFALNSGAHIAEIMRSALTAVDHKQLEAARMLGFSAGKAFVAITLPQAGAIARPVYQNATINLLQWTSVVGYVTITDLTRSVNNIGARTGDPFFALFFGVLIYLGLAYLIAALFALGSRRGARS